MLKERNERGRHRDDLARRNIHILDFFRRYALIFTTIAAWNKIRRERSVRFHTFRDLSDFVIVLVHGRKIFPFVSCLSVFHNAVRLFQESVFIDARIDCERNDKTDVRTFRSFNRAHASVMSPVNIAHFETGTVAGKSTRSQCVETSFVSKFGQRVALIHKL